MKFDKKEINLFQNKVLSFYDENKRSFPWRQTTNPYLIWVSEVMLQQTQTSRVISKFNKWVEEFPTVKDLANSDLRTVLGLWDGLGYNNRARWLRDGARFVIEEFEGVIPKSREDLLKLKGVGEYTSRAIRIFAFNIDEVTVDTNIRRIFIHEFDLDEDVGDDELYELAWKVLPKGKSRKWHNALMDYGSLVLTSSKTGIKAKTKQGTFKGSNRWYRSKILKKVRKGRVKLKVIEELFGQKGLKALETLRNDEMVTISNDWIKLPT